MIMKYRWGFLDENDIFSECQPKVDDSTAIDFSQESNEIFYRGKLNGSIAFRFEFDDILSKGYNYEHCIVLQWYDADNDLWKEVWKGRFALTDCEIDYDTNTISVQPSTLDRYTKILDELETEYNLTKLNVPLRKVNINIRPCLQIYGYGDNKITNYIGNNYWEGDCDTITDVTELTDTYKFTKISGNVYLQMVTVQPMNYTDNGNTYTLPVDTTILLHGPAGIVGSDIPHDFLEWTANCYDSARSQDVTFTTKVLMYPPANRYAVLAPGNGYNDTEEFNAFFDEGNKLTFTASGSHKLEGEYGVINVLYARTLINTEDATLEIGGHTMNVYDFPSNDLTGLNLNYAQIMETTTAIVNVIESDTVQDDSTVWGLNYEDKYFVKPTNDPYHVMPVGQSLWWFTSLWWHPWFAYSDNIDSFALQREIRDCYNIRDVAIKLLQKAGWNGQYLISRIIGGTSNTPDYAGYRFEPLITPKSNVISSYYDTPAQNAPITLAKVFSMLKQAYKVYWYIDNNNNIHLEHISYFDNGYQYDEQTPNVLIDLESEMHTNTKNNKVFGQNKVKFDKQDMPGQFTFGWMDSQTKPFDGWAIVCQDNYVQQGTKDEIQVGDFSTDVDCILSSPNDISKEGFVLFALPFVNGSYPRTLRIEKLQVTDELGETYNIRIQNAEAAFVKIHENMWRYSLPCENVNINNENTTAKTTGRFKLQNVEFADVVMADILKDIDNCNKVIRTQQGDGHIKTLSINLNSLVAKGDLLFNFVGRWYYLKGTALGSSIIIFVNGESTTIEVNANKFTYRYKEPIATLKFNAADVVSVNFADCDKLDNLTSCDEMFDGCGELLAVDFGNKTFGAVTSANNMFRGCIALTTLICPDSSTWKSDLDLSDCPDLTLESFYDLIKFLYYYNAGVHTITPNTVMWNSLDADTQNDLIAKATDRGWTIGMPAQYSITGQSAANTVYATINGSPVEISVVGGSWQYDYNAPITSISFENDADVTDIDFSLSDGLAGVTSLNDAFKNCSGLTSVDFTNCDLSNVVSASDAFANCGALYTLEIATGTWKPDIDLSASVMPKTEMLNVIDGLFTYNTGTHTITFNSTIWDAMSVADQQAVFDAADLKHWTTNVVDTIFYITGKSTRLNSEERMQFDWIDKYGVITYSDLVSVATNANGEFSFSYEGKRIHAFSLYSNTTGWTSNITEINFDEDFAECINIYNAFRSISTLVMVRMPNATFDKLLRADYMFSTSVLLTQISLPNATFKSVQNIEQMFSNCVAITNLSLPKATFENTTNANNFIGFGGEYDRAALETLDLPEATFEKATNVWHFSFRCRLMTTLNMPKATFESVNGVNSSNGSVDWMRYCGYLTTINVPQNSTAIKPTSSPTYNPMYLADAPLTYASMLKVANWLSDLTGQSAHTCTFKSSAWNALSAAEQSTIDTILSGKNWNRAIA